MTPQEAADLAARTLAAIDALDDGDPFDEWAHVYAADRERVASDLAGIEEHAYLEAAGNPCPDAVRYTAGLKRTARLYGVTP